MEQVEYKEPKYRLFLHLVALGQPIEEIAEELDFDSVKAACDVLASPFMADELEKVKDQVREQVKEIAEGDAVDKELAVAQLDAAQLIGKTIKNGDKGCLAAALKMIELHQRAKPQQVQVDTRVRIELTDQQAQLLSDGREYVRETNPQLLEAPLVEARLVE